jgi:hypothetical protein
VFLVEDEKKVNQEYRGRYYGGYYHLAAHIDRLDSGVYYSAYSDDNPESDCRRDYR